MRRWSAAATGNERTRGRWLGRGSFPRRPHGVVEGKPPQAFEDEDYLRPARYASRGRMVSFVMRTGMFVRRCVFVFHLAPRLCRFDLIEPVGQFRR